MKKKRITWWWIWLCTLGAIFAAFFSLHKKTALMNRVWWGAVFPLERKLAALTACVSLSIAEVAIISVGVAAFFGLTYALRRRKPGRFAAVFLCGVGTIYAAFCLLWGTAYYADGFQEQSGLRARGGTVEELYAATVRFADGVRETAGQVPRDQNGVFAASRQDILVGAEKAYLQAEKEFPCLHRDFIRPKAFVSSRALSALDFTGFYFPLTGEANVNIDSPAVYLPATVCHEMAHQRGYASEQECNFLGILAAVSCGDPTYAYSGYLMGYVYLSNALYTRDQAAWQKVRDMLPPEALQDLRYHSAYWDQFTSPVKTVSNTVYDGFLKANGDHLGIQSYGTVVDLLLAYEGESFSGNPCQTEKGLL